MFNPLKKCLDTSFNPLRSAWRNDENFRTVMIVSVIALAIIFALAFLYDYKVIGSEIFWSIFSVTAVIAAYKLIPPMLNK